MQRLTGDFITSSEMGHLKKLGTAITRSSLTIFSFSVGKKNKEKNRKDRLFDCFVRSRGMDGERKERERRLYNRRSRGRGGRGFEGSWVKGEMT